MQHLSRDRWFSLFAATLGVSAACNHDGDAPPVTAHEAPGFSDAAIAPASSDSTVGDAGAPELAPSATTEIANDAAAPNASAAPTATDTGAKATPDAGVPATEGYAHLGWFVALSRAPTPPPPKTPPPKPPSLSAISPNCGASANCGASNRVPTPVANVQLLLAPRPGLTAADAEHAANVIAAKRARATACVRAYLNQDPTLPSTRIAVRAQADGAGKPATVTLSPPVAAACLTPVIAQGLGGDDKPATLTFNVDVVVEGR